MEGLSSTRETKIVAEVVFPHSITRPVAVRRVLLLQAQSGQSPELHASRPSVRMIESIERCT